MPDTITDAEEANVLNVYKGGVGSDPDCVALQALGGGAYFGWEDANSPYIQTVANMSVSVCPYGTFFNLYNAGAGAPGVTPIPEYDGSTPIPLTVSQLQYYATRTGFRKLFLIGRNELNSIISATHPINQLADYEVQLISYQIDQLYAAGQTNSFTPLIYLAGGSQYGAPSNPYGNSVWIQKLWNRLDTPHRNKISGFHLHYYFGADQFCGDFPNTTNCNPHGKTSVNAIKFHLQKWVDWMTSNSINKKLILSETGGTHKGSQADEPPNSYPTRIQKACRALGVQRWFWYGYSHVGKFGDSYHADPVCSCVSVHEGQCPNCYANLVSRCPSFGQNLSATTFSGSGDCLGQEEVTYTNWGLNFRDLAAALSSMEANELNF